MCNKLNIGLFEEAESLLGQYKSICSMNEHALLNETISRLNTCKKLTERILSINQNLLESNSELTLLRESFNQKLSKVNILELLKSAAKKDKQLAEWLIKHPGDLYFSDSVQTEIVPIDLYALKGDDSSYANLAFLLHNDTESLYHNLWEIILRLGKIDLFKKFKPSRVRDIRNRLIEHSEVVIYSFSLHTNGPILRNIREIGSEPPQDEGVCTNVEQFLHELISKLKQILSNK